MGSLSLISRRLPTSFGSGRTDVVISTLEQVAAKVQRARLHMTALEAEIAEWEAKNERSVVVKPTYIAQEDAYVFRISRVPDQSPLIRWGTSIGDFLYNARSGLDYLAWHAAIKSRGGSPARPRASNSQSPMVTPLIERQVISSHATSPLSSSVTSPSCRGHRQTSGTPKITRYWFFSGFQTPTSTVY